MANKVKTAYFCSECGSMFPKWSGQCPACKAWNTLTEEVVHRNETEKPWKPSSSNAAKKLEEIDLNETSRLKLEDAELNRVLGGGLVQGSLILVGGEPGIGKSTLMLQMFLKTKERILYVSGEESLQQIGMRARRIGYQVQDSYLLTETNLENIIAQAKEIRPRIMVVDSIQTLQSDNIDSSMASISQIKECAAQLQKYAKESGVSVFIVGHITKDGSLAGPKILEHIVDVVLQFEGDRNYGYRILRSVKNRYGSTNELGIYQMQTEGLREVSNPSEVLLSQREENLSGTAIAASIEGLRPLMVEIQALVGQSPYSVPQRSSTGFDLKRMNMLLAVLEKRIGFKFSQQDIFINIAGGFNVSDPALDLAVIVAILSSANDIAISAKDAFAAEIGLTGEIRPVNRIEQRIMEAEKLGFERIYVSKYNQGLEKFQRKGLKIIALSNLFELFKNLKPRE